MHDTTTHDCLLLWVRARAYRPAERVVLGKSVGSMWEAIVEALRCTLAVRVESLARAVVMDTLEGHSLYRDAVRMLGFRSQSEFDRLAVELGVAWLAYVLDKTPPLGPAPLRMVESAAWTTSPTS